MHFKNVTSHYYDTIYFSTSYYVCNVEMFTQVYVSYFFAIYCSSWRLTDSFMCLRNMSANVKLLFSIIKTITWIISWGVELTRCGLCASYVCFYIRWYRCLVQAFMRVNSMFMFFASYWLHFWYRYQDQIYMSLVYCPCVPFVVINLHCFQHWFCSVFRSFVGT